MLPFTSLLRLIPGAEYYKLQIKHLMTQGRVLTLEASDLQVSSPALIDMNLMTKYHVLILILLTDCYSGVHK